MNKNTKSIRPNKNLGQNFLTDPNIINKIINACDFQSSDHVVEIGPGLGALTMHIAPLVRTLHAVEKDKNLYSYLCKDNQRLNTLFYNQDILTFDFSLLPSPIKVVGNIPYAISSPIIEKLIENKEKISQAFIMVQLEFGRRLGGNINTKDYSALTCAVQYYADPKILFKIKNSSFSPKPKVESCFIRIDFKKNIYPKTKNEKLFLSIIKKAFQQRRKQIQNALASLTDKTDIKNLLQSLSIDPQTRAENLSVNDFIKISNAIDQK
jgi:16S rRNA (adenine1518-N6/adenine1519-N6)-dimethyltransferase